MSKRSAFTQGDTLIKLTRPGSPAPNTHIVATPAVTTARFACGREANEGPKQPVSVYELGCPITSVAWSADGASIYAGALDNEIHVRFVLLETNAHMLIWDAASYRSLISVEMRRCIPSWDTLTRPRPSPFRLTANISSPPLSPPRPSFTTSDRSPHHQTAYTEFCWARPLALRTPSCVVHGARTMAGGE